MARERWGQAKVRTRVAHRRQATEKKLHVTRIKASYRAHRRTLKR